MKIEDVKVVSVFGSGTMGNGIAQVMAQRGYKVYLNDVKQEFLNAGLDRVKKSLQRFVEKGTMKKDEADKAISLIKPTLDIEEAAKAADFVIEAIPEKVEMKRALFQQLDKACKKETILATNTSTLGITELASIVNRPEKFIGMHFFNPVPMMRLVEIIKGLLTSNETIAVTRDLVTKIDKESIVVTDSPGFATSRLGMALYLEASRMLEEGVAGVEDIDKGMKLGYAHRMGPFETCDLVGLDARLNNLIAMHNATFDPMWKPPKILKQLVTAGYLGKKPGSKGGYYTFFGLEK